jgi:uncharacterized membrane protein YgcG
MELGRLGIIKIEKIDKKGPFGKDDYSFTKLSGMDVKTSKLKDFQAELLKELFRKTSTLKSVKTVESLFKGNSIKIAEIQKLIIDDRYVLLSALKLNFYEALNTIKDKLYKSLVKDEIFAKNPRNAKAASVALYTVFHFMYSMTVLSFFTAITRNPGPLFFSFILIIPGIFLALNMPKRKAWGYSLFRQSMGLKHYLEIGKWREEIAEKNLFVGEMLPLAIALGVVDKLANDMKELGIKPPNYMGNFTTAAFVHDFNRFSSTAATNLTTAPQSSHWSGSSSWSGGSGFSCGGGFSGGGGGGGGGGSW